MKKYLGYFVNGLIMWSIYFCMTIFEVKSTFAFFMIGFLTSSLLDIFLLTKRDSK